MEVWWFCSGGVLAVAFCARRWRWRGAAEQVVNCAIWWRHGEDDREWHRWMVRLWLWEKNSRWRKVQRWWCEGAAPTWWLRQSSRWLQALLLACEGGCHG